MNKRTDIEKNLSSHIRIEATAERIWKHITNVQIAPFPDPWYFHLLDIPKPIRAEISQEGTDGRRIAYFANGKKFEQQILEWDQPETYAFTFDPEPNFRVGWLFDLANGPFQLVRGGYHLQETTDAINLELETTYQMASRWEWILDGPVYLILKLFQRYLLQSIKQIAEADDTPHPKIH